MIESHIGWYCWQNGRGSVKGNYNQADEEIDRKKSWMKAGHLSNLHAELTVIGVVPFYLNDSLF